MAGSRQMKLRKALGVAAAAIGAGVTPVHAHHSLAVFDGTRVVKIEGTVTGFRWVNPHASIQVDGIGEGDAPDGSWSVEMTAPNVLIGEGWKGDSLVVGDRITLFANPARAAVATATGNHRGLYVGVVLPDGHILGRVDASERP
jgi:hypothetical protein